MSEPITSAISDRICQHMNEDHPEALVLYAKTFGNSPDTETATMICIDPQGMNLQTTISGETIPLRINFERELKDAEDAHHVLIEMVKQARKNNS